RRTYVIFVQAEYGIRDATVTGVQTCALPISHSSSTCSSDQVEFQRLVGDAERDEDECGQEDTDSGRSPPGAEKNEGRHEYQQPRSEERRVGKVWRCWGRRGGCVR